MRRVPAENSHGSCYNRTPLCPANFWRAGTGENQPGHGEPIHHIHQIHQVHHIHQPAQRSAAAGSLPEPAAGGCCSGAQRGGSCRRREHSSPPRKPRLLSRSPAQRGCAAAAEGGGLSPILAACLRSAPRAPARYSNKPGEQLCRNLRNCRRASLFSRPLADLQQAEAGRVLRGRARHRTGREASLLFPAPITGTL